MSIKVKINGKDRELSGEMTLPELMDELGLNRHVAIVERNRVIVKREEFDLTRIADGDELEFVRFVGGG